MKKLEIPHRFVVFGVCQFSQTFVEFSTDDGVLAAQLQDWLSCSEYKARIFDNLRVKFINKESVPLMLNGWLPA